MPKIAIIRYLANEYLDGYNDVGYRKIIDSITEWTDVSDEDFQLLRRAMPYDKDWRYILLEFMPNQEEFIENTIQAHLKRIKDEEAKREREAKRKKEKAEENKRKRELATYERLKKKLENKDA